MTVKQVSKGELEITEILSPEKIKKTYIIIDSDQGEQLIILNSIIIDSDMIDM